MGNEISSPSQITVCEAKYLSSNHYKKETVDQYENCIQIVQESEQNSKAKNFLNSKFIGKNSASKTIEFKIIDNYLSTKQSSQKQTGIFQTKLEESFHNKTQNHQEFEIYQTDSDLYNLTQKPHHLTYQCHQQATKQNFEPSSSNKLRATYESYDLNYKKLKIKQSNFVKIKTQDFFNVSYQILEKLGQGTTGTVFKALCRKTKAIRAVKIMKTKILKKLNQTEKLHFQLDILRNLDHPNIIKVYDVFFTEENYYVITEFCSGGTLLDYVAKNSSVNERLTKLIMKQLFGVLSYIHDQSIIHRDIKLDNIVFDIDPNTVQCVNDIQIKIIDFGLAMKAKFKSMNKDEPHLGTPLYMAPQILKGNYSEKCDIWSCGVILHYLFFNELPYQGENVEAVYLKISSGNLDFTKSYWKNISEKQKIILLGLLERNFMKRMSANEALSSQWFQDLEETSGQSEKDLVSRKLSAYKRQNNFIRLIESYLIFLKQNNQEQRKMISLFHKFDKNSNGVIDLGQLKDMFTENSNTDEADMVQMLGKIDKNNSGKIQFSEFMTFLSDRNKLFTEGNLEDAFDFLDQNKNGYIDKKQLKRALEGCQKEEYKLLWKDIDQNADQNISKEQFMQYLLRMEELSIQ